MQRAWGDEFFKRTPYESPLQDLMLGLVDLLETDSEESQLMEKEKTSRSPKKICSPTSVSAPNERSTSIYNQPSTPPYSHSRFPQSYDTLDNKRKISDTSFGTGSTETTPTKLVHPEAKVQSLQNTFVKTMINKLWLGNIDVPWAKGRHMFLTYSEFSPASFTAYD